jgi:hypothetical protein
MNPGFKYPVDENVLRSKLLETTANNMDQAWEGFELYLAQQKPIFTESKKTHFALMIPPKLLLRGFLACLIILPSLLFYRQFNAKIPAAIDKAYAPSKGAGTNDPAVTRSSPPDAVQKPAVLTEPEPLPQTLGLNSGLGAQEELVKKTTKRLIASHGIQSADSAAYKPKALPARSGHTSTISPASLDVVSPPQTEQTGELNEQL